MLQKIRSHELCLYLFIILTSSEFAACHHKQKESDDSIISEMPLPDVNKTTYSPPSYQKTVIIAGEKIYDVVEQMPQFPGGNEELLFFISKRIHYPIIALENKIQGRVICRFVVTRTGRISQAEVVRSLDPACDREALRVIKSLPKFIPGKQNGKNVNVRYVIPINFKLE